MPSAHVPSKGVSPNRLLTLLPGAHPLPFPGAALTSEGVEVAMGTSL